MVLAAVALVFVTCLWGIALFLGLSIWLPVVVTLVVVAGLTARFFYQHYRANKATRDIERALERQAEQFEKRARPDQRAEVRALSLQFNKALAALRSSRLQKGQGGALYALPWYVIVGPPGAGKTTAIAESGLKFPLQGANGKIKGIGGTRNCDWWLSNEAVLIDTAGRYATEDDDRDEWLSFLDMLGRARPKRPLNGLIAAVSVAEVAAAGDTEIEALSLKIRERIDEVMARLGVVLPVYVLLTKCDLIPGFIESFEGLRRTERAQVMGFTFAVNETEELSERVEAQWLRLAQVMERRSVARIAEARGRDARQRVYEFPQQLEALRANVTAFLSATFVDNVYQDAPLLRGVYLTSGTQVGSPVDRLMGSMAAAFGLHGGQRPAAPPPEPKSYFLTDLFATIMFADQQLAVRNSATQKRVQWLKLGVAGLLTLFAAGVVFASLPAFAYNRGLIASARQALDDARSYQPAGPAGTAGSRAKAVPLAVLEPVREQLAVLREAEQKGAPLRYRLGLYQGDKLLPVLRGFYADTLRAVLMESLTTHIAGDMSRIVADNDDLAARPSLRDYARLYEQTRAYLLLTGPSEPNEPPLEGQLRARLSSELVNAWAAQAEKPPSIAEREAMASHVDVYLELLASDARLRLTRDVKLVRDARAVLARLSTVKLAVDRVIAELDDRDWDLGLEQVLGAVALPITATSRVRGAFTRRAWEEVVRARLASLPNELAQEGWVLEPGARSAGPSDTLACALQTEYLGRYIAEWRGFIARIRVEEPPDYGRAIVILQDLTRGQPAPIERLMRAVARESQLADGRVDTAALKKAAESVGVLDKIQEALKEAPLAHAAAAVEVCQGVQDLRPRDVQKALEGFFSFGASVEQPGEGAPPRLTSAQVYQEQLEFVRDALQAYMDDPSSSEPLAARLTAARQRVRSLIDGQEVGWRPRFDAMLWPPISGASSSTQEVEVKRVGDNFCTSVVTPFDHTLRDRYPFARHGEDAALADLAEFYRPNSGVWWSFYETRLRRDIPQVGSRFEPVPGRLGSAFGHEVLRFLDRSQNLTTVLFPAKAEQPRVDFEVMVRPSTGIAQIILTIDGQVVDFHNGPPRWVHIVWPGDGDQRGATMRVKGANIDENLTQAGEWGWFRLLDKGTIYANPGERFFTARWRLHTQNDVTIDVRPARVENPFVGSKGYLDAFRAPGIVPPRAVSAHSGACSE